MVTAVPFLFCIKKACAKTGFLKAIAGCAQYGLIQNMEKYKDNAPKMTG